MTAKSELFKIVIYSALLRIVPILVLSKYENIQQGDLFFTDIDYKVYSDSTLYASPYQRHTYRYTPILSYLMQYNYSVFESIGKLAFVIFDIFAIFYLWSIIASRKSDKDEAQVDKAEEKIICNANFIAKLYGYNPLLIYLTVRGSCEAISMALMFAFWFFWTENKVINGNLTPSKLKELKIQQLQPNFMKKLYAYVIFGIWVHFRVYPIIFLPLLLIYEYKNCVNQSLKKMMSRFFMFGVIAGGVFCFLFTAFYSLYGDKFMNESYLYHFTRKDNRHSFSPFFYEIYLNYSDVKPTRQLPSALMLFVLTTTFSGKFSLFYLHFLMTFCFVEFNSVITLQYYMWVWGALLLVLPESRIITFKQYRKGFNLALQWVFGISLWVWISLRLENDGENIMTAMWIICLIKIGLDLWVLLGFIKTVKAPTPDELKMLRLEQAKQILMAKKKKD